MCQSGRPGRPASHGAAASPRSKASLTIAPKAAPCPGPISLYYAPGGHGIRIDSHVYGGYVIPQHYDSMIGKVIAFGRTRELAIDRMYRALSEHLIRGIETNIPFLAAIMRDPVFRAGHATTSFIEEFLARVPKDYLNQPNHE